MKKIDLSTLTRDELRDLLRNAKNEWTKYTNCKDLIELYEKQIIDEQEKQWSSKQTQQGAIVLIIICIIMTALPDGYRYEYALTKMLQDIDNFKAHNWKEVTTLYDRYILEHPEKNNTRITEDKKKDNNGPTLGCLAVIVSILTLGLFRAVNNAGKDFGKS